MKVNPLLLVASVVVIGGGLFFAGYTLLRDKEGARPEEGPQENGDVVTLPSAVVAARTHAGETLRVRSEDIVVVRHTLKEWPDACLGIAKPEEMCASVITEGFEVVMQVAGETVTYRTNRDGTHVRRE